MPDEPLKPEAIRGLLAHLLAGAAGGSEAKWRERIGDIVMLPIATHVRCNWRVTPTGSAAELEAIRQAVAVVAAEHPYVSG